ncbi:MAG: anti-sigma factor antagonist [Chitinivibrionales bacterium]|nr:anti-sigma factor antagonist [Chitinivibrionales bacterium]MBD3394723.1 anti-sigma factor antagonist [Chitinivibrionales bacterium]
MKVDIANAHGITVVRPHGDIRVKTILALRSNFDVLDKERVTRVAIDLSEVAFIDSSGIGLLANFAKRLHARDGRMCLFNYSGDVKDLLDITGIDQAVALCDTMEEMHRAMMDGAS